MATYNGRRGPNFSRYLRNLNVQDSLAEDNVITDEDLRKEIEMMEMYTNTQFFDFETGQNTDFQAQPAKPETTTTEPPSAPEGVTPADTLMPDFSGLEFLSGDFNYGDFGTTYSSPTIPTFPDPLGSLQPIQPSPQAAYPQPLPQPSGYAAPGPLADSNNHNSEASSPRHPLSLEEQSRRLADEDKRRRNTAASARFRIKKKQREQALEKSAKEMTEKVTALEGRISTLETENKWLRSLVMDKHVDSHGKDELAKLLSLGKDELSRLSKEIKIQDLKKEEGAKDKVAGASDSKGVIEAKPPKSEQ